jgi:uncharacterized membrane protein
MGVFFNFFPGHPLLNAVVLLVGIGLIACGAFSTRTTRKAAVSIGPIKIGYKEEKKKGQLWLIAAGLLLVLLVLVLAALR